MVGAAVTVPPRRVLVVDDSAFMRKLIAQMVEATPGFTVAGFARDGVDALAEIDRLAPDIITLDLEMPHLDGLEVLARMMHAAPIPVIVLSAGQDRYEDATLRALELGAVDFVRKPSGPISLDLARIQARLDAALNAAAQSGAERLPSVNRCAEPGECPAAPVTRTLPAVVARHLVVIASSTGGPRALAEIIPALAADLPAAVVIAQHLPGEFTASLAARLDRASALRVVEAEHGMVPREGTVYVAPGGMHTRVGGTAAAPLLVLQAAGGGPVAVAPSADMLFHSAAAVFSSAVTGVVLTGMGRDGADGLRQIRACAGRAIVQDRETCAIYGMPRAALSDAGADQVVPLAQIACAIDAAARDRLA